MAPKYKRTIVDKKAERGVKSGAEGVDKSPKEPSSKQTPSTVEFGTKRCGAVNLWSKITRQVNVLFNLKGVSVHNCGIRLCIVWLYSF